MLLIAREKGEDACHAILITKLPKKLVDRNIPGGHHASAFS
jgi:hypothetical protein